MLFVGVAFVAEAALTVLWQEPLSAYYNAREQGALADELRQRELLLRAKLAGTSYAAVAVGPHTTLGTFHKAKEQQEAEKEAAAKRQEEKQRRLREAIATAEEEVGVGSALGRLSIDKIKLDTVVVQGTDDTSLRTGPGHYLGTALPGERGTVGIAGHRTTYSAPFRNLDKLGKGDSIRFETPYGDFAYSVEGSKIVSPQRREVLSEVEHSRLVLTACHPLFSAAQRIVVFARLRETRPS